MDLIELLSAAQGGQAFNNIGRQFGLDEKQTEQAIGALAPVLAAGVRRNIASDEGYESLISALSGGKHQQYFDNPDAIQFDRVESDGNRMLGHVLGSKDTSRDVANYAAGQTGIGAAILKKLLPIVISMIIGSITKGMAGGNRQPQGSGRQGGGGLGDILGDVLGGGRQGQGRTRQQTPQQAPGGFGDILRDILGGGMAGGGSSTRANYDPNEKPDLNIDETIFRQDPKQGREVLEDYLGRGSSEGTSADDLLNSVEKATRGRR